MSNKRVLPADVWDTLELSALAFEGIGAGHMFDADIPLCVVGHACYADSPSGAVEDALWAADIWGPSNDFAVRTINRRRGTYSEARVPFEDWAKELNVVRGAA